MEHILSFGLGIMLVSLTILAYMVVESNKKVSELESLERFIENLERLQENTNNDIYKELQKVDSKIDSRIDKLNDVILRELDETNRKVEFLRKSLGKDYF